MDDLDKLPSFDAGEAPRRSASSLGARLMTELPIWADKGVGFKVLGILGGIAGAAVGQYAGVDLLIPLLATALVWWGGSKLLKDERKEILPAFAVNAGHFLWLSLGLSMLGAQAFATLGLDLVLYAIGLAWLLKKPSIGPLILLGIYQALSLGINGYSLAVAAVGSGSHKALLVHVIWRAMALFFIAKLFFILRRKSVSSASNVP